MSEQPFTPRQRTAPPSTADGRGAGSLSDAVDRVELFGRLDRQLRRELIAGAEPRHYQRGELLYAEGEAGKDLLLLLSGAVVLYRSSRSQRRAMLAAHRPPGLLGEEALAGGVPRMVSAEAIQDSFVLALAEPELSGMMQQHPAMAESARRWLALRLGWLAEQRADDLLLDLPARVAKTLLGLAGRDGAAPQVVELNQQMVAALARGSRQSVNQTLQSFASRGWLRIEKCRILVVDRDALARRAGRAAPHPGTAGAPVR